MNSINHYLSHDEPDKSNHLWKYTPWRRIHPTGKIKEIPEMNSPHIEISNLDKSEMSSGIILEEKLDEINENIFSNNIASSFLMSATDGRRWKLSVESGLVLDVPILVDIFCKKGISSLHLELDIGKMSQIEIITRVNGDCEWFGLLREVNVRSGANVNDIVLNLQSGGSLLRFDSVEVSRDAQIRAGTVSSGSSKTKADLRYFLNETGANLKALGSILSVDKMHLDYHIEILHDAPETQSRLAWHSACGGSSKTVGTGMLRVKDGSIGADAAQIFHNLLLSSNAEADSIPELEVMEHDVVGCGHGTANGPIDEEQEFYLQTRGFSPQEAKAALIAAFLNTTLSQMGSEKTHEWLIELLSNQLESLI